MPLQVETGVMCCEPPSMSHRWRIGGASMAHRWRNNGASNGAQLTSSWDSKDDNKLGLSATFASLCVVRLGTTCYCTFRAPVSVAVTHADMASRFSCSWLARIPALHLFCTVIKIERPHKLSSGRRLGSWQVSNGSTS
jgi:hypothetical protein